MVEFLYVLVLRLFNTSQISILSGGCVFRKFVGGLGRRS